MTSPELSQSITFYSSLLMPWVIKDRVNLILQRGRGEEVRSQKGFRTLKCTIMNRFIESDGTSGNCSSPYLEGWVISTTYPKVLVSQFESAMQQRCAPAWDRGAAEAHTQVWWGCLWSVLFTDVSSQGWLKEITFFKRILREKCSLLVCPVLGMGNKM